MKDLLVQWANQIGTKQAVRRLTDPKGADLGVSTAEKLVAGRYKADVAFETGWAILQEMAKDGFTLTDGEVA